MRKLLLSLFAIFTLFQLNASSQEDKPYYKFGGMIDAHFYHDSYNSVEYREGVLYFFPKAPDINSVGVDMNKNNRLRANILSSRLSFSVGNVKLSDKAKLSAYVETDFLGASDALLQHMRIRHAYVKVDWAKSSLLMGQYWNMSLVPEMVPNTVSMGEFPFLAINRNPMIQYTYKVNENITLDAAAQFHLAIKGTGPSNAQAQSSLPDMQARIKLGKSDKVFGGVMVGTKFLKPRTHTTQGYAVEGSVNSTMVTAFFKATHRGHTFRLNSMYGGNLSMFYQIGGYGMLQGEDPAGDYDYSNIRSISSFFDYQYRIGDSKWELGLFAAHQANLGSSKPLELGSSDAVGYYQFCDVNYIARIAPRIAYYPAAKFMLGIEYGLTMAEWGKEFDAYYEPTETYDPTKNHRIEAVARFWF